MIISTLLTSALIALAPVTPVASDPYTRLAIGAEQCTTDLDCFVQHGWAPDSYVDKFVVPQPGDQWVTVTDNVATEAQMIKMVSLGYTVHDVNGMAGIWAPVSVWLTVAPQLDIDLDCSIDDVEAGA